MLGLPIRDVIEPRKPVTAAPDATVREAARLMKKARVGAILVVAAGRLAGIFTERDALFRVVAKDLDPRATPLSAVMAPEETFGYALLLMYENGFRHVPVVKNGRAVGMVSARHALDPELEEFAVEAVRRKAIRRKAA